MVFFFSLVPATLLVVLGYFVLFSTTKTAGAALVQIGVMLLMMARFVHRLGV